MSQKNEDDQPTVRALTVLQPWAHLIALPESHPDHKRIENRGWQTHYRGTLLIHAGKSDEGLYDAYARKYRQHFPDLLYGRIVARAEVIDCFQRVFWWKIPRSISRQYPEMKNQKKHANGPFCWMLAQVQPLPEPVECRGAQGLWIPPAEVLAEVERQLGSLDGK